MEMFFENFPPLRHYHGEPVCSINFPEDYKFSASEKIAICNMIQAPENVAWSIAQVANYLKISYLRVYKIIKAKSTGKSFQNKAGHPRRLDDQSMTTIRETILARKHDKRALTKTELNELVRFEVVQSDIRLGKSGLASNISDRTIVKILHEIHASFEKGQTTTNARAREAKDIRNFVSMAAMNHAFGKGKVAQMIGNVDATQFRVEEKNGEMLVTIKEENDDSPLTRVDDSPLDLFIKWIMLCNANGHLGQDVFLLADPTMKPDELITLEVKGLSHCSTPKASGWICFTATRCGNVQFFKWYIETIVIPFVCDCRALLTPVAVTGNDGGEGSSSPGMSSNDDEDSPTVNCVEAFYLVADGEKVQIAPLDDEELNQTLKENHIDFGKGPASCTNTVGNACDRSNLFKATKKTLKSQPKLSALDVSDSLLQSNIIHKLQLHRAHIPGDKMKRMAKGIVRILRSLSRVVNFQIVQHGFERTGAFPLDADKCLGNCDKTTLDSISFEMRNYITSTIPDLAEIFIQTGQITEDQFDAFKIPKIESNDKRTKPKDQRELSNQRAVMMNSDAARQRRKQYLLSKLPKAPVITSGDDALPTTDERPKRKRKPNRSKEVIAAEKAAKLARKQEREQKQQPK